MRPVDDDAYRLGLGLASLLMAIHLAERETDDRRRARKHAVLLAKWDVVRTTFPDALADLQGYGGTGPSVKQLLGTFAAVTAPWSDEQRRTLLVDALMGDPFAPYELQVAVEDVDEAIGLLAGALGLDDLGTARLWDVWNDALEAYRPSRWRRPDPRRKAIPALMTHAFVLPPAPGDDEGVPHPHGSAHRRALLSGGALAADDPALAGGLWLVAATGDRPAMPVDDRVHRLLALELGDARAELVKVQMSHALVVEPDDVDGTVTAAVLAGLDELGAQVAACLDVERERNDDDAPRIRRLQELTRALDLARSNVERVRQASVDAATRTAA